MRRTNWSSAAKSSSASGESVHAAGWCTMRPWAIAARNSTSSRRPRKSARPIVTRRPASRSVPGRAILGMLATVFLGLATFLRRALLALALGAAAVAIGLALAGRGPVDRLGAGLHREGDDVIGRPGAAAAGEQGKQGGNQGKLARAHDLFSLVVLWVCAF